MERVETRYGPEIRCLVETNKYIYLPGIFNDTIDDATIAEFDRNTYYLLKERKGSSKVNYELTIMRKQQFEIYQRSKLNVIEVNHKQKPKLFLS
ncbi:hypothetical protein EVAR_101294_1 [Eumeta japonica]|uniref:Uncharacterized protein n=1 Tax=Eumeta variegata TaxID=151549 RepID=A0A4C1SMZ1_EUMVA|nr:hypothetical protein EVAR_101294_1 [Eumeta japonica]